MKITWDDHKEQSNIRKHGVDFEEASTVILNPLSLYNLNRHPSEKRFEYIGYSDRGRILYVVTVEERDDHARVLSARKATSYESEKYQEG